MDWRKIKENWGVYQEDARRSWPELTDEDVQQVQGNRTELIAKVREHYGWTQEQATLEADRWADRLTGDAEVTPDG